MPNGMRRGHRPLAPASWGEQVTAATTRPATLPCCPAARTGRRERAGSRGRVPRDEADDTVSDPSFIRNIVAHLPLMRARACHWVQRWERAPAATRIPLFSSSPLGTTARLGTIVPSWPGPRAHPVRVCGAKPQPQGALSVLDPVERLAGDPVVAAPLQACMWVGCGRLRAVRGGDRADGPDPALRRLVSSWWCRFLAGRLVLHPHPLARPRNRPGPRVPRPRTVRWRPGMRRAARRWRRLRAASG